MTRAGEYLAARDVAQKNTGWQAKGTWAVPGAVATNPAVSGLSPASGNTASSIFTVTVTAAGGWQDLGVVNVLVNNVLDGRQSCYLAYSRSTNTLFLVNDAGTALLPGLALNGSGGVSNSQCAVNGSGSSASGAGNTLTLTLSVSWSTAFSGNRIVYLAARDGAELNHSGWQAMGSWVVP